MKPGIHQVLPRDLFSVRAEPWKGVWVSSQLLEVQEPTFGQRQGWALPDKEHLRLVAAMWLWQGAQWEKRT